MSFWDGEATSTVAAQAQVGDIKFVPVGTPPEGWLECDGAELAMDTYTDLHDHKVSDSDNAYGLDAGSACTFDHATDVVNCVGHGLINGDVIELSSDGALPADLAANTKYYVVNKTIDAFQVALSVGGTAVPFSDNGVGNHKWHDHFTIPDWRGEFVRGWDHGRGVDIGRALGSGQLDELKSHTHTRALEGSTGSTNRPPRGDSAGGSVTSEADNPTGGAETRPRNKSAMAVIKY